MAKFIALITETQQGEAKIADSVSRAAAFRDEAAGMGIAVQSAYWTMGEYDGVLIFDAPDDETATAAICKLNSKGAIRTHTMRAFSADEMKSILGRLK
jgi:uncharacterized protein with GYD domain